MNGCRLYRFITIVILIISITTTSYADDDQSYINCNNNSYKCGDITISYPFYGALNRPAYCGFPGFKLDCQNDILTMTVSDISYQVFYIDYALESLTVVRRDYWDIYCQKHLIDTSIDSKLFNYGSKSYNLSLYYGCPAVPSEIAHEFSCPINGTKTVGYYLTRELTYDELPILTLLGTCSGSVKVPVFESAGESLNDDPSVEKLVEAIRGGFGLEWIADSKLCKECVDSGGICGYAVDAFVCYCSDKPYATICSSSSRSSRSGKRKRIAFTIGLASGGAIIACIGVISLVFCVRKRRNQLVSQSQNKGLSTTPSSNALPTPITNFSRTTGSYPSSLSTDLERGSVYFGVQVFTYSELEEATNNFDSSRELGDGGFGVVYLGKLLDGRVVAVKRLYENNFRRVEQFINEVQMLARLRHQNLVTLYGCTSRRSQALVLVYEYISNGTVADHLHGKKADSGLLTWPVRLSIAIETASALAYLHKSDIIHRDVKTTNILLDDNFRVKVADFGLSRLFPSDVTHVSTAPQGTPGYVDPEYYQCYQLTDKSDVYSFGVVLVELISSLKAVDTSRHRHNINLSNMGITKIQNQTLHELVDPCLGFETDGEIRRTITMVAELAFQCLQQDTDVRPSMEEVLESLKMIETDEVKKVGKAEVMDIQFDDVGLLKNMEPPPFSPISVVSAKWVSSSSTVTSSF